MTKDEIISDIIEREGREYSNRAADRGGPTKFGITLFKLIDWRRKACTSADVEALQESEAREIYEHEFIVEPGYDKIADAAVQVLVIDSAVQHGTERATRLLQKAAHVFPDGNFGPKTAEAVNRMTPKAMFLRMYAERQRFYGEIISHDGEAARAKTAGFDRLQAFNAFGWANRMADLLELTP